MKKHLSTILCELNYWLFLALCSYVAFSAVLPKKLFSSNHQFYQVIKQLDNWITLLTLHNSFANFISGCLWERFIKVENGITKENEGFKYLSRKSYRLSNFSLTLFFSFRAFYLLYLLNHFWNSLFELNWLDLYLPSDINIMTFISKRIIFI